MKSKSTLLNEIARKLFDPELILKEVKAQQRSQREALGREVKTAYVAPQTEVERIIASVWQELLHLEKVGLHDNFFDLGGHSLLLVQVNSRLRNIFQKELPLLEMFNYPTVSTLAQWFGQEKSKLSSLQPSEAQMERLQAGKKRLEQRLRLRQDITKKAQGISPHE